MEILDPSFYSEIGGFVWTGSSYYRDNWYSGSPSYLVWDQSRPFFSGTPIRIIVELLDIPTMAVYAAVELYTDVSEIIPAGSPAGVYTVDLPCAGDFRALKIQYGYVQMNLLSISVGGSFWTNLKGQTEE